MAPVPDRTLLAELGHFVPVTPFLYWFGSVPGGSCSDKLSQWVSSLSMPCDRFTVRDKMSAALSRRKISRTSVELQTGTITAGARGIGLTGASQEGVDRLVRNALPSRAGRRSTYALQRAVRNPSSPQRPRRPVVQGALVPWTKHVAVGDNLDLTG
jgi:hypothetical protein